MVRCTAKPSEQLVLDDAARWLANRNLGDMREFTSLLIATKLAGSHKIAPTQHRADTACKISKSQQHVERCHKVIITSTISCSVDGISRVARSQG